MPKKRGRGHLNSTATKRDFEERYGVERGDYVFGATVGKVRAEQVEAGTRSAVEDVPGHISHSSKGRVEHVRPFKRRVPRGRGYRHPKKRRFN